MSTATSSYQKKSDRRSTLETNPPESAVWWIDDTFPGTPQQFSNPRTADSRTSEFKEYRSFLIEKGPNEYDGQTYRYMTALEDEYMEDYDELNEELDVAIQKHNVLQQQYTTLREEKRADRKKFQEEINRLKAENAEFEEELTRLKALSAENVAPQAKSETAATPGPTPQPDVERLLAEVLELRHTVRERDVALSAAHAAVVQATLNVKISGTDPAGCPPASGANALSFHINNRRLPTFDGTRDAQIIADFLSDIKRAFLIRCQEIGWLRNSQPDSTGWSTYAIGQLRGPAGRWADAKYPSNEMPPAWDDFVRDLRAEFTPLNTVRELVDKWTVLRLAPNGHVATFNEEFRQLRQQLDLIAEHALNPTQTLQAYMQKVRGNTKADEHLTAYIELRQDMGIGANLENAMQYTAKLDRKEAPKDKATEISAMYMTNTGSNRKTRDGKRPQAAVKIDFSSVVPGGKGLGPGGRLGPEQCAVCYANGHMSWECKDKKGEKKDKRKRGARGSGNSRFGKQINVTEGDQERKVEEVDTSESESDNESKESGKA
jgi:hypothetical protein